ncbi:hypothetical protein B0A55_02854 [Friedmanniomyces simplex]|uniref:Uncharacterized protein n=1 Tax=Friedmanniomyces simplex TaxID=329884 RepID=A0A4U0XWT1_9PEZI|nr:hypothetical protein B0A55_02854 [Friedmanniomyces simplex]
MPSERKSAGIASEVEEGEEYENGGDGHVQRGRQHLEDAAAELEGVTALSKKHLKRERVRQRGSDAGIPTQGEGKGDSPAMSSRPLDSATDTPRSAISAAAQSSRAPALPRNTSPPVQGTAETPAIRQAGGIAVRTRALDPAGGLSPTVSASLQAYGGLVTGNDDLYALFPHAEGFDMFTIPMRPKPVEEASTSPFVDFSSHDDVDPDGPDAFEPASPHRASSEISTGYAGGMGLDQHAKPLSNAGWRTYALYQVQFRWKGALEDQLAYDLRPQKPVHKWGVRLLKALANLAAYGEPDEINGLLRMKVWERKQQAENSIINTMDVYAVSSDLERLGRRPQEIRDYDYF